MPHVAADRGRRDNGIGRVVVRVVGDRHLGGRRGDSGAVDEQFAVQGGEVVLGARRDRDRAGDTGLECSERPELDLTVCARRCWSGADEGHALRQRIADHDICGGKVTVVAVGQGVDRLTAKAHSRGAALRNPDVRELLHDHGDGILIVRVVSLLAIIADAHRVDKRLVGDIGVDTRNDRDDTSGVRRNIAEVPCIDIAGDRIIRRLGRDEGQARRQDILKHSIVGGPRPVVTPRERERHKFVRQSGNRVGRLCHLEVEGTDHDVRLVRVVTEIALGRGGADKNRVVDIRQDTGRDRIIDTHRESERRPRTGVVSRKDLLDCRCRATSVGHLDNEVLIVGRNP